MARVPGDVLRTVPRRVRPVGEGAQPATLPTTRTNTPINFLVSMTTPSRRAVVCFVGESFQCVELRSPGERMAGKRTKRRLVQSEGTRVECPLPGRPLRPGLGQ